MSTNGAANVVDLTAERARRQREDRTVIIQAANIAADTEVHRQIGLNDALHLADLKEVLVVSFGLSSEQKSAPSYFSGIDDPSQRLDSAGDIYRHLAEEDDVIVFHWGLWDFTISAVGTYPRDAGTPRALCVGGSGAFGGKEFDLAGINAELTGTTTIREVLALAKPAVRSIIDRSGIFDFVPLLQALELSRGVELPEPVIAVLESLPVEDDSAGRDAFWATTLALSCMGDEDLGDYVLATTMDGLNWEDDDGTPLTGESARQLCADSLEQLASVGGYGSDLLSPVDRLDLYRELLSI